MAIRTRKTKDGKPKYDVVYRIGHKQYSEVFSTKHRAVLRESEIRMLKEQKKIGLIVPKKILFAEYAKEWLEKHSKINKAPSSHSRDEGIIRLHLNPHFGKFYLHQLTQTLLEDYIVARLGEKTYRGKQVTKCTVNHELEVLRKMLNDAVKKQYLDKSPIHIELFDIPERDYQYLEKDEAVKFLEAAEPCDKGVFATALYTGLRKGEIFHLKKSSIDMNNKIINITEGGSNGTTKNKKLGRIPIHSKLLPFIEAALKTDGEYLFPSVNGGMRNDARKSFRRALSKAGIAKPLRFHDLRHTFASHFMMDCGNIYALKTLGRWADNKMVSRYTHLSPNYLQDSLEKLNY